MVDQGGQTVEMPSVNVPLMRGFFFYFKRKFNEITNKKKVNISTDE